MQLNEREKSKERETSFMKHIYGNVQERDRFANSAYMQPTRWADVA